MLSELRGRLLDLTLRSPHDGLHVLVDMVLGDPLADAATRSNAAALPIKHPDMKADHQPYLLKLGDFGRDLAIEKSLSLGLGQALRSSDELMQGRSICLWILSDANSEELALHLASQARIGVGRDMKLFRFWDPRVMDTLEHMLRPEQVNNLLGPASTCLWLNRAGDFAELRVADDSSTNGALPGIRLDNHQLDLLRNVELVNRALDVLQDMGKPVVGAQLRLDLDGILAKGGREWKLQTDRELVTYAMYGYLIGAEFDQVAEVRDAMLEADNAGTSPVDALDQFDERYWQTLTVAVDRRVATVKTA
jgi:hypothetical protein